MKNLKLTFAKAQSRQELLKFMVNEDNNIKMTMYVILYVQKYIVTAYKS